ncbi:4-oxalocrotonate tautomerase [Streptomyces sp. 3211.6]|uniref:tautomerase family protein n=1 Tax=Streptomyces TaxID=1883 RepID=UPI0009A4AFB2|nr:MULTISPECIES: tautomerase family protein [Streptomyces]RKS97016.1 4-oxalocrotonate tautomerase [Streptomyces sp. 3211.6]RPF25384.1 4-oxalocrotonate tautomerase [Streptomyces sp. Ag109_G2-6]
MPHIHIWHYPRDFTAEQLKAIDEAVTAAVTKTFATGEDAVSISLEPVGPEDWESQVLSEIAARPDLLVKRPGYLNES